MSVAPSPERWAIDISLLLNAVLGNDRFPVDVALVAKEYSAQRYPDDPVSLVIGRSLPGFDGALYPAPAGKKKRSGDRPDQMVVPVEQLAPGQLIPLSCLLQQRGVVAAGRGTEVCTHGCTNPF